jgi:hypothetical protein
MSHTHPALSEADKSEKTCTLSTDQELPICNHKEGRKYVPIQTTSPVALASLDVQQRKIERDCGSVALTSSPYVKKTEGKCCKKKERERQVCRRVQLCSVDIVQKKTFDAREDIPCLYCNKLFPISEPGESWIQYTD